MSGILIFFALSFIFKSAYAWWAAAARGIEPIILSFGAAFATFNLNEKSSHDLHLFNKKVWSKNEFQSKAKVSDQVQKTITGPIAKNNKIMNESKKENDTK